MSFYMKRSVKLWYECFSVNICQLLQALPNSFDLFRFVASTQTFPVSLQKEPREKNNSSIKTNMRGNKQEIFQHAVDKLQPIQDNVFTM